MKKERKGFTLIELLVVVLIIGILAALAVPKYEMAVEKARAMKAVVAVKALTEAAERYYMANGAYPDPDHESNLDTLNEALDVEITDLPEFRIFKHNSVYIGAIRRNSSRFNNYMISLTFRNGNGSAVFRTRGLTCNTGVNNDTSRSAQLCKTLCKTNTLTQVWGSASSGCEIK